MQLLFKYIPPRLDIPIVLFKALRLLPEYESIDDRTNHWQQFTSDSVIVYGIEGDHSTILDVQQSELIGHHLKACLDEHDILQ